MAPFVVAGVIALAAIALLLATYAHFARMHARVRDAWAATDVELRRRHDLVPELVNAVRERAAHEFGVLNTLTSRRIDAMALRRAPDAQCDYEHALTRSIRDVLDVVERSPELQGSARVAAVSRELDASEARVAAVAERYNDRVRVYDRWVRTFPSLLAARLLGFTAAVPFAASSPSASGTRRLDLSTAYVDK